MRKNTAFNLIFWPGLFELLQPVYRLHCIEDVIRIGPYNVFSAGVPKV